MTETYSKQNDFPNGLSEGQLHQEILDEPGITTPLIGIVTDGDAVYINFQSTITTNEKTLLDTIVQNHIPLPPYAPKNYVKLNVSDVIDSSTNATFYTVLMTGMLPSVDKAKISAVYLTSKSTGSPTSYDVRAYDVNAGAVIASINLNNSNKEVNVMTLSNDIILTETVIEIQAKRNGGTDNSYVYVYDVSFEY